MNTRFGLCQNIYHSQLLLHVSGLNNNRLQVKRLAVACSSSQSNRHADLLGKAAKLREQQQQLHQALNDFYQGLNGLAEEDKTAILELLQNSTPPPPASQRNISSQGSVPSCEVPPSVLRTLKEAGVWDSELLTEAGMALPRGLPSEPDGAMHEDDEEYVDGDEDEIKMEEGVEEFARIIEEGGTLPPLPPEEFLREPEPAEQFKARIQASIDAYEGMAMKGKAKGHTPPGFPEGQGAEGEDGEEEKYWDEGFQDIPVVPEEIEGIIPAPEPPEHIMDEYHRMERILLVLRRGFLAKDPVEWVDSLYKKGLLSERVAFVDPWVGLAGPKELRRYMWELKESGAIFELDTPMARCKEYDPKPHWQIIIDACLHLPIPTWYQYYLWLHPEHHRQWERYLTLGARQAQHGKQGAQQQAQQGRWDDWSSDAQRQQKQWEYVSYGLVEENDLLVGVAEHGQTPGQLYPRVKPPPHTPTQPIGTAHHRWFPRPSPGEEAKAPLILWVSNPFTQLVLDAQRKRRKQDLLDSRGKQQQERDEEASSSGWWTDESWDESDGESVSTSWDDREAEWREIEVAYCPEGVKAARFERFALASTPACAADAASPSTADSTSAGGISSESSSRRGNGSSRSRPSSSSRSAPSQPDYSALRGWLLLEKDWAGQVAAEVAAEVATTGLDSASEHRQGHNEQQEKRGNVGDSRGQMSDTNRSNSNSGGGGGGGASSSDTGIHIEPDPDKPLTKQEAEWMLRGMLGDKFDSIMAQMPSQERRKGKASREQKPGEAYKDGRCLTFTLTFGVELDTIKGEVVTVCCTWGAARGAVHSARDAFEIYAAEAGLNPLPPGRHVLREVLEKAEP